MGKKLTTEQFVKRAKEVHGDNYDYSLVDYKGKDLKVKIICPSHGIFEQNANSHMRGVICKKCAIDKRRHTVESLIEKFNVIHDFKYDYSLIQNLGSLYEIKLSIICPKHGLFQQSYINHIQKCGCPKCANEKATLNRTEILRRFNEKHNFKYDYRFFDVYDSVFQSIAIVCPKHGKFGQKVYSHLQGNGCKRCADDLVRMKLESFVERANFIHYNNYDYSFTNYINNITPITIICPKHGSFIQTPMSHIYQKSGCPKCANHISKPEIEVQDFVKSLGFKIKTNDRKMINPYELDIYIPELKKAIEFNGFYYHYSKKHFIPEKHSTKSKLCKSLNINLLHLREDLWNRNKEKMKKVLIKFLEHGKIYI